MSILSKCFSNKQSVQLRKLYLTNNHFARSSFNHQFHQQKRFQSHSNFFLKPTLFCLFVSSSAIIFASIIQYERLRSITTPFNLKDFYGKTTTKQNNLGLISELKNLWEKLKPSQKVFTAIFVLNSLVLCAWQIPRWQHVMVKYFTTDALAKKIPVSSLLLSAFSHSSIVHFGFNMFALHSFCQGIIQPWGVMAPEEFSAMYISACVVSSLASIVFRRTMKSPGISLGASGAILSVVSLFALSNPHAKLGVIFMPDIEFDAINSLYFIMILDSLGMSLGWKIFDHAAHFGGSLFGIFWYNYVSKHVWGNRKYIVRNWIALKKIVHEQTRKW